jgi:protein-L-isoaspartate(D-aspartate) O-methyltransferase
MGGRSSSNAPVDKGRTAPYVHLDAAAHEGVCARRPEGPLVASSPVLFTVAFRREMARLPAAQRQEWLTALALKMREPGAGEPLELAEVARGCRLSLVEAIAKQLGPFDTHQLNAVLEVPRERFVRREDVGRSADDTPLPLDGTGLATISAPHAYLLSYRLLRLAPGDSLVELGTGSGYGAALAAAIVGPKGRVLTIEIDAALARWARDTLRDEPNVTVLDGDAVSSAAHWGDVHDSQKVVVTFAVDAVPRPWLEALRDGGRLVAPVGKTEQRLVLVERRRGVLVETDHGAVRYVKNRSTR